VEDARTWEVLAALGCDMAQGYFISPPLLADEILPWLARWKDPSATSADRAA
jgi:EAL domain-containing protein (putative c-di-GMP-specific phosphodiesterase class I)